MIRKKNSGFIHEKQVETKPNKTFSKRKPKQ